MTNIRVGTTKSRHGCIPCKQRRVKCDETRDEAGRLQCQRCKKSGRICVPSDSDVRSVRVVQYIAPGPAKGPARPEQSFKLSLATRNPVSIAHMGSFRSDCFSSLPIAGTYDVQLAFDNLFPMFLIHMEIESRTNYLGMMMKNPMLFETMIVFSKITLRHNVLPEKRLTVDMRAHLANILASLRPALEQEQIGPDRALVLTICYLSIIYQQSGDMLGFKVHLNGLRRLYGSEALSAGHNEDGFVAARVGSAELFHDFSKQTHVKHWTQAATTPQESLDTQTVPPAFHQLDKTGMLSGRSLYFLNNLERYLGRPYMSGTKDRATTLLTLRMIELMQKIDRPTCVLRTVKPV